ncbi:MAG: tetratricopeptide repeat protein [Casimicrobium sp.]
MNVVPSLARAPLAVLTLAFLPAVHAQNPQAVPEPNNRVIVLGILAAEFSLQNGDVPTAASTYYEVAKRSKDAKVSERAVELLLRARRLDDAREISSLWLEADSAAVRPLQIMMALALTAQDESGTLAAANRIAKLPDATRAGAMMDVARQLAQHRDRDGAVKVATVFTEQLPTAPESFYALSAASTGTTNSRINEAMLAIDRALTLRPHWAQAVAVKSRLLLAKFAASKGVNTTDRDASLASLSEALTANPEARELRVLLARTHFDLEQFKQARVLFTALAEDGKDDTEEMRLAATLSAYHAKDFDVAEGEFLDAIARERGDPGAVRYYLGRISENRKRWSEAAERFAQVPRGERYWESQLRVANALAQDKRMLQAVSLLRALKPTNALERSSRAQAESSLWREAGDNVKAFEALDTAISADSTDADLIYESAMLAERIDRAEEAEKRLRRVIVLQPDRAHAYNALGYSFADRNINLDEARTLIEKAHQLAPDDAAILDSMGWVSFRQGRFSDAERYLRQALEKFADGEIAAHLGEVLWAQGRYDEARMVWRAQLKLQPDSDILKKTMAKFDK